MLSKSGWQKAPGLLLVVLLAACASPQPRDDGGDAAAKLTGISIGAQTRAPMLGAIDVKFDGKAPRVGASHALLASGLRIGDGNSPVRFETSYSLAPGDTFSSIGENISRAPTRLGGQRLGQRMVVQSPELAGSPIALGVSSEMVRNWTTTGFSQTQREQAELRWSSSLVEVDVLWMDAKTAIDASMALACDLRGSVRVPVSSRVAGRSHSIKMLGRDCGVTGTDSRYDNLAVQNWGLAYAWKQASRELEVRVSKIDPIWRDQFDGPQLEPSYEVGVSHQMDRGEWRAKARVALRQTSAWRHHDTDDWSERDFSGERDSSWISETALTRHLQYVSVSANWSSGADPLWFTPEGGHRRDRFGMEVDFSRGVQPLMPELTPKVAMRWDWSRTRLRDESQSRDNRLALNMSVNW